MENDFDQLKDLILGFQDNMNMKFEAVDRRFEIIDHRFEDMDRRFDSIDQKFKANDLRFSRIEQRLDGMDLRFDAIEHELGEVKSNVSVVRSQVVANSEGITTLGETTLEFLGEQRYFNDKKEEFDRRLGKVERRIKAF